MVHGQHRTSFSIGAACLLLLIACCTATAAAAQHISPVKSFFKDVDVDGDGQLQQHELQHFVGSRIQGSEAQTKQQIKEAALQSIVRLDGNDAGSTISEAELESFLHTVLKGTPVAEWMTHGLGLPQYAAAFQANAVNALDFPLLIQDQGHMLQHLLGVDNPLHRARLLRAMQRQMLGLGHAPGAVPDIKCSRGAHNSLSITWLSPVQPGKPPFHKYVLERLPLSAPGSGWEFVADAVDVTRWLDLPPPGVFQYRVVAWNVYGRGPAATSAACAVPPADVGGVEAPAGGCAAGSSDSCRRAALPQLHWNTPASAPGERHTTGPPPQQLQHSSEDGVVATQGLGPGASTQAFGGVHSEQQPGAVTAGATAHTAALHPSDPAGAHPSQVTAGAWRAFVKKAAWWLWTAFNTVLVLVLPACVRLLPVSVLHRAYQLALGVVARTLLFLGRLVRSCKPSAAAAADGANKTAAGGDHKVQAGPRTPTPPALQQAGRHAADIAVPGPEIQPAATVSLNGPGCWEAGGQIRGVVQEPDAQQPHSRAASSSSSHNSDGGALPVPFHERSSTGAPRGAEEVGWLQEGSTSVLPLQPLAPWDGPLSAGSGSAVVRPREGELGEEAGHGALNGQPLVMPSGLSSARVSAGPQRHIRASSSGGRQWAVPAGGLPHSSSGNSLTAGSHSEAGAAGHQQWRAVSMVDNLVADPAAAGVRAQLGTSASAPQLQLLLAPQEAAGIGSHSKKQCAHPGCEQRFDSLRNLGAKRQRHNCGRCLRTVCLAHTAYSTHGTSGPCGVQSRCVCVTCFAQFTPEYQMLLAARNTLCAGGGAAAGGLPCGGRQRRPSSSGGTAARLLGRSPSLGRMQAAGVTEAAMGPAHGESGNAEMRGLIGGLGRGASGLPPAVGGSRGRLMWARTWTKLHAVHQFNRAARSSQQQDSQ